MGRSTWKGPRVTFLSAIAFAQLSACVDETHDLQVQALGSEVAGVPPGPDHRPGEPCLVCHGAGGPASPQFVIAGTVYAFQGETSPAVGAQVVIQDVNGSVYRGTTNDVGNFYVTTDQWSPTLPAQVQVALGNSSQEMATHISRAGSCAECHTASPGPTSPGPVYVAVPATQLGLP